MGKYIFQIYNSYIVKQLANSASFRYITAIIFLNKY